MNRCAACGRALAWHNDAPTLWDGTRPFLFCSTACRDRYRSRDHRRLPAAGRRRPAGRPRR